MITKLDLESAGYIEEYNVWQKKIVDENKHVLYFIVLNEIEVSNPEKNNGLSYRFVVMLNFPVNKTVLEIYFPVNSNFENVEDLELFINDKFYKLGAIPVSNYFGLKDI